MKPLFYLLLVICFSTIFSCKKEKIAQTPTPASPTTIVPNATVQQLAGVWRLVKQEVYDNNVLFYSYDSTEINTYATSMNNNIPHPPNFIELTTVPSWAQNIPIFFNYNILSFGTYNTSAFYLTPGGGPDPYNTILNTSGYDKLNMVGGLGGASILMYANNPNNPPLSSLSANQLGLLQYPPNSFVYIRVLDAHNLVVSSWGDNVFADGIKSYYCR